VADQRGLLHAGGVEQRQQPVGQASTLGPAAGRRCAVAGQVHRQHAVAVVREPARQQRPHAVVVQRAVDEDDAGQGRVEGLAAGVGVGLAAVDDELHAAFSATLKARFRSSIRSSASSRPMLSRIVPGVMPAAPAPRRPCGSAWCWPGG
jgi:hypothetical protein